MYDKDPMKHDDAVMYSKVSFMDALNKNLKVMDATALSLCMEEQIPIRVFNIGIPGNIEKAVFDDTVGTWVTASGK